VAEFVGDQIFAVLHKAGDQPDHAVWPRSRARAPARRRGDSEPSIRTAALSGRHHSGEVLAGVVGDRGHRIHGVFGDTVNLGARLEGQSPVTV